MDSKSKYVEMDTISPTSVPNYSSDDGEELVPVDNSYASYEAPVPQPRNSNVARKQLTEIPSAAGPKKTALCLTMIALIVIVALAASGGFAAGTYYTTKTHGTTVAVAKTTLLANTSVDPCEESIYDFACGGYSFNHNKYSNLGDFQLFLNDKISSMLLTNSKFNSTKGGLFFKDCLDYAGAMEENRSMYEYFGVDAFWMWQRGFEAYDLVFGRTIDPSNTRTSKVYIANMTYFNEYHSAVLPQTVVYNRDVPCSVAIVNFAREIVDNGMIASVLYYGDSLTELCNFANDWLASGSDSNTTDTLALRDETFTISNMFDSDSKCLRTTSGLWPGLVSDIMDVINVDKADTNLILDLCTEIKTEYSKLLTETKFINVALKILSVECSASVFKEHYVYDVEYAEDYDFVDYAGVLLRQKFIKSIASANVVRGNLAMTASDVNAAYSSVNNKLVITPAMAMFSAETSERRSFALSRIGFVLAHELSHAVDNNGIYFNIEGDYVGETILDDTELSDFDLSVTCMAAEFKTDKLTLQEDIADHLAIAVVTSMIEKSKPETDIRVCSPECTDLNTMQQFYVHFAQTWCTSESYELMAAELADVHSTNVVRVKHALAQVDASKSFKCKSSSEKPETKCTVYGL